MSFHVLSRDKSCCLCVIVETRDVVIFFFFRFGDKTVDLFVIKPSDDVRSVFVKVIVEAKEAFLLSFVLVKKAFDLLSLI